MLKEEFDFELSNEELIEKYKNFLWKNAWKFERKGVRNSDELFNMLACHLIETYRMIVEDKKEKVKFPKTYLVKQALFRFKSELRQDYILSVPDHGRYKFDKIIFSLSPEGEAEDFSQTGGKIDKNLVDNFEEREVERKGKAEERYRKVIARFGLSERDEKILRLYQEDMSFSEIGRECGLHHFVVIKVIKRIARKYYEATAIHFAK